MKKRLLIAVAIPCLVLALWACSKVPETYYPLGEGKTWKYQVSKTTFGVTVGGQLTVTNLEARQLKGRKVTPRKIEVQAQGRSVTSFEYVGEDDNGVYTFAWQDPDDVDPKLKSASEYQLKKPLKVGSTWDTTLDLGGGSSVPAKATIESIDEVVDVPAGTFKGCLKVHTVGTGKEATGRDQYDWFAPSVGLVKSVSGGVNVSMQLESFTK